LRRRQRRYHPSMSITFAISKVDRSVRVMADDGALAPEFGWAIVHEPVSGGGP
jgi:hypothetical protein